MRIARKAGNSKAWTATLSHLVTFAALLLASIAAHGSYGIYVGRKLQE